MKKAAILALVMLLALGGLVAAQDGHEAHSITLLSVAKQENGTLQGGEATLYLQLRPGTGKVFLESYPLAGIDTQVATRVANEIACEFTEQNCNKYDFFYTIRADSPIIGGPSAGGATALLTLSVLEDIPLRKDFAMTGGIGSGGIITAVSAIPEKLNGAKKGEKILAIIPQLALWEENQTADLLNNITNVSDRVLDYLTTLPTTENIQIQGVQVVPVLTLQEALEKTAANNWQAPPPQQVAPTTMYTQRMQETAQILCDRTEELFRLVNTSRKNESLYQEALDFKNYSRKALQDKNYYSQASYCYSANIHLREAHLQQLNQTILLPNYKRLITAHKTFENDTDAYHLETFSDLETYNIVKERLLESAQYLAAINETDIDTYDLALAMERYHSAVAWSAFFGLPGLQLEFDELSVKAACAQEIQQVEGRREYLETVLPDVYLADLQEEITQAYSYISMEAYELCLFKASKANAHANFMLSASGLTNENYVDDVVYAKLERAGQLIAQQEKNEVFPILGYSYYEYAEDILEAQPSSALLFSEYALTFSDLGAYFDKPATIFEQKNFYFVSPLLFFLAGLLFGLVIGLRKKTKKKHPQKRSKRAAKHNVKKS